jgi:hypothetical protein
MWPQASTFEGISSYGLGKGEGGRSYDDISMFLVAYAEIVGAKEKVFKTESRLKLTCLLRDATAAPEYIFW